MSNDLWIIGAVKIIKKFGKMVIFGYFNKDVIDVLRNTKPSPRKIYHLERIGDDWKWQDVTVENLQIPLTTWEMEKYPWLKKFILAKVNETNQAIRDEYSDIRNIQL